MLKRYKTIAGRNYDLSVLSSEERAFLDEVFEAFSFQPGMTQFINYWMSRGRKTIWEMGDYIGSHAYRICQDLQARLGIAQKKLSPPDYRDQIAALIEERFRSRYQFCKEIGIDEGHLSRVLAGKKEFALETFLKILRALKMEIELVPLKHSSDYLEIDNPVAELGELDRRVKWLLRRKEELVEPDRDTNPPSIPGDTSASSLQDYLPDDIAALSNIEAVTQALQETLVEMAQLAQKIALRAEDQLRTEEPDENNTGNIGGLVTHLSQPNDQTKTDSAESESESFRSLANRPHQTINMFVRRSQQLYAALERNAGQVSRRLPPGLLKPSSDCAYLFFPTDESASQAFIAELVNQLNGCPSIVAAGLLDYGWVALDVSSIKGAVDFVGNLADRVGVEFFPNRDEYQRFRQSRVSVARQPEIPTQMLERWMRERCVIRYMVKPSHVLAPILSRIVQARKLKAAGLSLSLMHASIFEHGFVDFFVLDRNQNPVSAPDQLRTLFDPEFYTAFGVAKPYQLHNWSDFIHLGLEKDVRIVVKRSLMKNQSKPVPKEQIEDVVQQFLAGYPAIIAGISEEVEGKRSHSKEKPAVRGRREPIGLHQEKSFSLILGFSEEAHEQSLNCS